MSTFKGFQLIRISKDTFKCNRILPERAKHESLELFISLVAILVLITKMAQENFGDTVLSFIQLVNY